MSDAAKTETTCCAECPKAHALTERVEALEKVVLATHARALGEHEGRLDEHDRRFARMEAKLDRVVNTQTADSLVLQGVHRMLASMAKALKVEVEP